MRPVPFEKSLLWSVIIQTGKKGSPLKEQGVTKGMAYPQGHSRYRMRRDISLKKEHLLKEATYYKALEIFYGIKPHRKMEQSHPKM